MLCDAPNSAPEVDVERGCHAFNWDSLTFSFSELTPAFICTISVITKFFLHLYYTYHHSGIHYILYTYTRVPFTYTITISLLHIKSEITEAMLVSTYL